MRLVYHIAAHDKPWQLDWLASGILADGDRYMIHIDRKAGDDVVDSARRSFAGHPDVVFQERQSIIYSEWRMSQIEIDAIRHFVETSDDWDYFVNLSGQCYPLRPIGVIKDELARTPEANYIKCLPFDSLPPYFRRRRDFFCFRAGDRLVRTPLPWPRPRGIRVDWHGSAWHILTRPFCEWLLSDPTAQRIMQFHRHTKMPMEMVMQTLIMNSPFRDTTTDHRRCILWEPHTPHPITLRREHLPKLLEHPAYFARKFDAEVDREVLEALRDRGDAKPAI